MFTRALPVIVSVLSFGALILNVAWLAVLALPFSWLWNLTLVPLASVPAICYGRAVGILLLWLILQLAGEGVKLSAGLRDPT